VLLGSCRPLLWSILVVNACPRGPVLHQLDHWVAAMNIFKNLGVDYGANRSMHIPGGCDQLRRVQLEIPVGDGPTVWSHADTESADPAAPVLIVKVLKSAANLRDSVCSGLEQLDRLSQRASRVAATAGEVSGTVKTPHSREKEIEINQPPQVPRTHPLAEVGGQPERRHHALVLRLDGDPLEGQRDF
jgi:hypothetical protein